MIPLKLTLQGLGSYTKRTEIDFATLSKDGLFGIFGKVGSGKSTIMDAILIALYGIPSGELDNKMNLSSGALHIEFECMGGPSNSTQYKVVRSANKKSAARPLHVWENKAGKWVEIEEKNPGKLISDLNKENFNYAVVIPQGEFSAFINVKESERSKKLKLLFNLERFDLKEDTAKLVSQSKKELDFHFAQLSTYADLSEEALKVAKGKEIEANEKCKVLENDCKKLNLEINGLKLVKGEFDRKVVLLAKLNAFLKDKVLWDSRKERLDKFTHVKSIYEIPYSQYAISKGKLAEAKRSYETILTQWQEVNSLNNRNASALESKSKWEENIANFKLHSKDYSTLSKLAHLRHTSTELLSRKEKGDVVIHSLENDRIKLDETINGLTVTLESKKLKRPSLELAYIQKEWFEKKIVLESELEKSKAKLEQLFANKVELGNATKAELLKEGLPQYLVNELTLYDDAQVKSLIYKVKGLQNEVREAIKTQEIRMLMASHVGSLVDGEPCLLCGSLEHPIRQSRERPTYESSKEVEVGLYEKAVRALDTLVHRLDSKNENISEVSESTMQSDNALKNHFQIIDRKEWKVSSLDEVIGHIAFAKTIEAQISANEKNIKETQLLKDEVLAKRHKSESAMKSINEDLVVNNSQFKDLSKELVALQISELENTSESDLKAKEKQATAEATSRQNKISDLERAFNDSQMNLARVSGSRQEIEGNLNTATEANTLSEQKWSYLIKENPINGNEEEIIQILGWKVDIAKESKEMTTYYIALTQVQEELEHLSTKMLNTTFDHIHYDQQVKLLATTEEAISVARQALGGYTQEKLDLEARLLRKGEIEVNLNKATSKHQGWKDLNDMIAGDKFLKYVTSWKLGQLIVLANKRLYDLSDKSFSLLSDDETNIKLVDHRNGDATRSTKTLSGGQLFQVSLCMALALGDLVHANRHAKDRFFFIDEGFGSLDIDSRELVIKTLKEMAIGGQKVGLITHVEEIKYAIPVHISVTNTLQGGSEVAYSYK